MREIAADLKRFTAGVPAGIPLDLRIQEAPNVRGATCPVLVVRPSHAKE
jgi:hypothetical protein